MTIVKYIMLEVDFAKKKTSTYSWKNYKLKLSFAELAHRPNKQFILNVINLKVLLSAQESHRQDFIYIYIYIHKNFYYWEEETQLGEKGIAFMLNKPAAQPAGADPSRCNSTSRQNPHIQQNRCNIWTNTAVVMPFNI